MARSDEELNKRDNKRERQKEARGRRAANAGGIQWETFDWFAVIALTEALCRHGGALRLGQTRDGGAWAFGVYLGNDYATEYIRPSEDFGVACLEIAEAWVPQEVETFKARFAQLHG